MCPKDCRWVDGIDIADIYWILTKHLLCTESLNSHSNLMCRLSCHHCVSGRTGAFKRLWSWNWNAAPLTTTYIERIGHREWDPEAKDNSWVGRWRLGQRIESWEPVFFRPPYGKQCIDSLNSFILSITLPVKCDHPHFTDEQIQATCPTPYSWEVAEAGCRPRSVQLQGSWLGARRHRNLGSAVT